MNTDADRAAKVTTLLAHLAAVLADPPAVPTPVPTPPPRLLLTVAEAAEQLSIGRTTAWALIRSGDLDSVQIGRLRRVHVDAVAAYAGRLMTKHDAA